MGISFQATQVNPDGTADVSDLSAEEVLAAGLPNVVLSEPDKTTTRQNLSAAKSGLNTDITDLSGSNGAGIRFRASVTALTSAATTDIGSAPTRRVNIAGTTTITSLGTVPFAEVMVTFSGVLTLTHNATTLALPGAANIITAVGDTALFTSGAGGNFRCVRYQRASGKALVPPTRSEIGAAASGANADITSLAGLTAPQPQAARDALAAVISDLINSLPKSDAGLPVGALWSNGGILTRVETAS